jgi:haloacetate dehalogenase
MGAELVQLMTSRGLDRFAGAGHDRGGWVAYRMALDHSQAVTRLARPTRPGHRQPQLFVSEQ